MPATLNENAPVWLYSVVDVADNSTTVHTGKAVVKCAWVNTALSAHALPIKDGTTTVRSFAASASANTELDLHETRFETSIVVDPDDSATGEIVVIYKPIY